MREGDYTLSDTLTFNNYDCGVEDAPVVWSSYNNEKVTISNSEQIALSEFSVSDDSRIPDSAKGKVLSYNLKDNGIDGYDGLYLSGHSQYAYWQYGMAESGSAQYGYAVPEIFFGEKVGRLAEYPNNGGWMGITSVTNRGTSGWTSKITSWTGATMKVSVDKTRMAKWESAQNPWYDSYWVYDWSDMRGPFKSISSSNQTITTEHALPYTPNPSTARWRIYNLLEELDTEGEWYYDEESGELFIYPVSGMTDDDKITLAFQRKNIIELTNAHDISFKNLNITGTRGSGIVGSGCERVNIGYCRIYNLSSNAVALTSSKNCRIYRNTIENIGAKGVMITGGGASDPSGDIVENNMIKNYARLQKCYIGAVDVGGGGITVRNNEICYAPQLAIAYTGNDHEFSNNDIHHVLTEASDMGAIYRVGSFTSRGTVIKNNAFHDLSTTAKGSTGIFTVYFDNFASGDTATENIFYNIKGGGVFMNCGSCLTVTNNIFANVTGTGIRFACIDKNHSMAKNMTTGGAENYAKLDAYAKYPYFAEDFSDENVASGDWVNTMHCVIKNNVGYNTSTVSTYDLSNSAGSKTTTAWLSSPYNEYEKGYNFTSDPGFKNLAGNDYTLLESNSVTSKYPDFKIIDMSEIGIKN